LGGVALVPASYNAIGGTIHCATTAAPFAVAAHELLPAALEVSLNAQQFTSSGVPFTFFARPSVSLASPSSGPTSGGTLVRLRGAGLGAGARFRCRFGDVVVPATAAGSTLLCLSPYCSNHTCSKGLFVALNAQQFLGPFDFFRYTSPVFHSLLAVHHLFSANASASTFQIDFLTFPTARCRFGSLSSTSIWDDAMMVWGGLAISPFDFGTTSCITPPARQAGVEQIIASNFTSTMPNSTLRGSAQLLSGTGEKGGNGTGSLLLTDGAVGQEGDLVVSLAPGGGAMLSFNTSFSFG
jgi:hypothetical protein